MREYASCERCGEPILRYPGGMWEHAIDLKLDWDHLPEPEFEPLTEADAEEEYADDEWQPILRSARQVDCVRPSRAYL